MCIWESDQDDALAEEEVEGLQTRFGVWRCTTLGRAASLPPSHMMEDEEEHRYLLPQYAYGGDAVADSAKAKNRCTTNGTKTPLSLAEHYKLWYEFVVDYVHMWRKVLESPPQMVKVVTIFYSCILMWGGFWDIRRVYFGRGDMYLGMLLILGNYILILLAPQPDLAEAPRIEEHIYYGAE